eukprot:497862_1
MSSSYIYNQKSSNYIELVKRSVLGILDTNESKYGYKNSILKTNITPKSNTARTMIGMERLNNIEFCVKHIYKNNIIGDCIELGCWRGGASIFMKACMKEQQEKYNDQSQRILYCSDPFEGDEKNNCNCCNSIFLIIGSLIFWLILNICCSKTLLREFMKKFVIKAQFRDKYIDVNDIDTLIRTCCKAITITNIFSGKMITKWYYSDVVEAFKRYDLYDKNTKILKGFFQDTIPLQNIKYISILRLDMDLYEATKEALELLYDKVSVGGFVIVDDYYSFKGCKRAVDEFRTKFNIRNNIIEVDDECVYWIK